MNNDQEKMTNRLVDLRSNTRRKPNVFKFGAQFSACRDAWQLFRFFKAVFSSTWKNYDLNKSP